MLSRAVIYNTQMRTCYEEQKRGVECGPGDFFVYVVKPLSGPLLVVPKHKTVIVLSFVIFVLMFHVSR